MRLDSLGFTTDLALLELGGTLVEDHGDHLVVRSPHNPAHWWGNFLLLAQPPAAGESEDWIRRFGAEFPGATHFALGVDGRDGTVGDLAWFAEHGYVVEAQTVMTATAVHAPRTVNADAECRALRSDEDWAQSVELRVKCVDDGLDPQSYRTFSEARAASMRRLTETGHGGWFGAFVDGVLGCQMGLFRAGAGLARFQSVETDPAFRRRGLAGSLVHHVSNYGLDELGVDALVMVADPGYFAIDLYRAVGFDATESQLQVERRPSAG